MSGDTAGIDDKQSIISGTTEDLNSPANINKLLMLHEASRLHCQVSSPVIGYAGELIPSTQIDSSHPDDDAMSCLSELLLANGKGATTVMSPKNSEAISRSRGIYSTVTQSKETNSEGTQSRGINSEHIQLKGVNFGATLLKGINSRGKADNSQTTSQPTEEDDLDHDKTNPSKMSELHEQFSQQTEVSQSILEPSLIVQKINSEQSTGMSQDLKNCKSNLQEVSVHLSGLSSTQISEGTEELQAIAKMSDIQEFILRTFNTTDKNSFLPELKECVEGYKAILNKIRQGHDLQRGQLAAKVKQKGQTKAAKQNVREEMKMLGKRQERLLDLFQKQQEIKKISKAINLDCSLLSFVSNIEPILSQISRPQSSPRSSQSSDVTRLDPLSPKFLTSCSHKIVTEINSQDETQPYKEALSQVENYQEVASTRIEKTNLQTRPTDKIEMQRSYATEKVQSSPGKLLPRIHPMASSFVHGGEQNANKSLLKNKKAKELASGSVWKRKIQFPENFEDVREITTQLSASSEIVPSKKQKIGPKSVADCLFDDMLAKRKLTNIESHALSTSIGPVVGFRNMVSEKGSLTAVPGLSSGRVGPKHPSSDVLSTLQKGTKLVNKTLKKAPVTVQPTSKQFKSVLHEPRNSASSRSRRTPTSIDLATSKASTQPQDSVTMVNSGADVREVGSGERPVLTLSEMVLGGFLKPGANVLTVNLQSGTFSATLLDDGQISTAGGEKYKTPINWLSKLTGVTPTKKFTYKKVCYADRPLCAYQILPGNRNVSLPDTGIDGRVSKDLRHARQHPYLGRYMYVPEQLEAQFPSSSSMLLTIRQLVLIRPLQLLPIGQLHGHPKENLCTSTSGCQSITIATQATPLQDSLTSLVSRLTKVHLIDSRELVLSEDFLPDYFWKVDFKHCSLGDEMWKSVEQW